VRIIVRDVNVLYERGLPDERAAVNGITLSVDQGESVAIAGPTGSGKTSLLEVMAGLVKPTSGTVALEGADGALRSAVGLVYQFPELQFFEESVLDEVAFGLRHQGVAEEEIPGIVGRALERAGLDPDLFLGRSPLSLSAGEKRRAALACMIALDRPFLLLDEPSAGLDPAMRERLVEFMLSMLEEGQGLVLVTHDLDLADRVVGRMIVLSEGRIVADATPDSIFRDAALLERLSLDPPPKYWLVNRLKSLAESKVPELERLLLPSIGRHLADAGHR
jgi:energy-coupling factor transport system ATP-binding protein